MALAPLILNVAVFGLALWLGCYLLGRNFTNRQLRLAGWGLLTYAVALAGHILLPYTTGLIGPWFVRTTEFLMILPALLWTGVLVGLLPEDSPLRTRLHQGWYAQWLGTFVAYFVDSRVLAAVVIAPLFLAVIVIVGRRYRTKPHFSWGLILIASIFLGLSMMGILLPNSWLAHPFVLVSIGVDLICLGYAIAGLDAFDLGEALLPDMAYSLDAAMLTALLFGGLVAGAVAAGAGPALPMLALLLSVIALAIAFQTFTNPIQATLDRIAFANRPLLQQQRARVRATTAALPKIQTELDLTDLDEAEFTRLTRRALSNYGDLPRLATSPLNQMPVISDRMAENGTSDTTLERAAELKALLTEAISQLKPPGPAEFGSSDEWRHYNALYFPYVAGLRPYSRRATHIDLTPAEQEALVWFRTHVPERTLYNWQNAAAQLVARHLREI